MSRIARQPGDARLSRDGTAKLNGVVVGEWWQDDNDLYHFARKRDEAPLVTGVFRHELMTAIAEYIHAQR